MFSLMPWRRGRKVPAVRRGEGPFEMLRKDFGPIFDRLFEFPLMEPEGWFAPSMAMDTDETEKEYLVRAELPGFEPTELDIRLADNVLSIVAEHKEPEVKDEEKKEARRERRYARVERSILLPPSVDVAKAEATFKNGLLEVHVPKTPEAVGRKIEVKA